MLLQDIKEIKNGRCITVDGGVGSGVEGHVTAKQVAAMRERAGQKYPGYTKKDPGYKPGEKNVELDTRQKEELQKKLKGKSGEIYKVTKVYRTAANGQSGGYLRARVESDTTVKNLFWSNDFGWRPVGPNKSKK